MNSEIINNAPKGATHLDTGASNNKYLRINDFTHDYWECGKRWVTFEGGHNRLQNHWVKI